MRCEWLPELMPCDNWADFASYEEKLYQIFSMDFIQTQPQFKNKPVIIRRHPMVDDREQTFFHVITKDDSSKNDRFLDPKRCERIRWIRAFIENYDCDPTKCEACSGIKV